MKMSPANIGTMGQEGSGTAGGADASTTTSSLRRVSSNTGEVERLTVSDAFAAAATIHRSAAKQQAPQNHHQQQQQQQYPVQQQLTSVAPQQPHQPPIHTTDYNNHLAAAQAFASVNPEDFEPANVFTGNPRAAAASHKPAAPAIPSSISFPTTGACAPSASAPQVAASSPATTQRNTHPRQPQPSYYQSVQPPHTQFALSRLAPPPQAPSPPNLAQPQQAATSQVYQASPLPQQAPSQPALIMAASPPAAVPAQIIVQQPQNQAGNVTQAQSPNPNQQQQQPTANVPLQNQPQFQSSSTQNNTHPMDRRKQFFLFTKILLKHLDKVDNSLKRQAQRELNLCLQQHKQQQGQLAEPLHTVAESRLLRLVGPQHWNRAVSLLNLYLRKQHTIDARIVQARRDRAAAKQQQHTVAVPI